MRCQSLSHLPFQRLSLPARGSSCSSRNSRAFEVLRAAVAVSFEQHHKPLRRPGIRSAPACIEADVDAAMAVVAPEYSLRREVCKYVRRLLGSLCQRPDDGAPSPIVHLTYIQKKALCSQLQKA